MSVSLHIRQVASVTSMEQARYVISEGLRQLANDAKAKDVELDWSSIELEFGMEADEVSSYSLVKETAHTYRRPYLGIRVTGEWKN